MTTEQLKLHVFEAEYRVAKAKCEVKRLELEAKKASDEVASAESQLTIAKIWLEQSVASENPPAR